MGTAAVQIYLLLMGWPFSSFRSSDHCSGSPGYVSGAPDITARLTDAKLALFQELGVRSH